MSSGRTVGVLGGMGPAATWSFCRQVQRATPAVRDQDHLRLLVDCDGSLPDRNTAVSGEGPSPGPHLARMARGLEAAGAELLVMPCNAAHAFADDVRRATEVPFLSMIDATVARALSAKPGLRTVALLATTGTLDAQLYQRALATRGTHAVVPEGARRDELMDLVYKVKRGDDPDTLRAPLRALVDRLVQGGAEVVIAACSEIPLVLSGEDVPVPWVDASEALAAATVEAARAPRP